VVEAVKMLVPENVLLLERSVVEETVILPPRETLEPLIVTLEFCNWLLPMVVVETKDVPSYASSVPWVKLVAFVPPWLMATVPERLPRERHAPLMARQPAARLMPCANVDVALPVWLKFKTLRPPLNVDVLVLDTLRELMVVVPAWRVPTTVDEA